jgi:predicted amidohydrolase YtcJ
MVLDMDMIEASVGARGRWTFAFKDICNTGLPVLLGSDCPVCSPSPLVNIHAAVTRQRADGTPSGGWYPRQKLSVSQAVAGYTAIPAQAYGVGHELGSIAVGKRADLIVLDRNIFTIDPSDIINAQVDITIFDGRIVYQRQ